MASRVVESLLPPLRAVPIAIVYAVSPSSLLCLSVVLCVLAVPVAWVVVSTVGLLPVVVRSIGSVEVVDSIGFVVANDVAVWDESCSVVFGTESVVLCCTVVAGIAC